MTAEDRARVKAAIDKAKRERLRRAGRESSKCSGCGAELEAVTVGCEQCRQRERRRWRRVHEPGFRERELAAADKSRRLRAAGVWAR